MPKKFNKIFLAKMYRILYNTVGGDKMVSEQQLKNANYVYRGDDGEYIENIGQCGFMCDHGEVVEDKSTGKNIRYCNILHMQVYDYDSCKYYCDDDMAASLDLYAYTTVAMKALDDGDAQSQVSAGIAAKNVGRDDEAIRFFSAGVKKGSPEAHYYLAEYYQEGKCGSIFNRKKKAAQLFETASKMGHRESQFKYACACFLGSGVKQSQNMYEFWMICSGLNGYQPAISNLEKYVKLAASKGSDLKKYLLDNLRKTASSIIQNNRQYIPNYSGHGSKG